MKFIKLFKMLTDYMKQESNIAFRDIMKVIMLIFENMSFKEYNKYHKLYIELAQLNKVQLSLQEFCERDRILDLQKELLRIKRIDLVLEP